MAKITIAMSLARTPILASSAWGLMAWWLNAKELGDKEDAEEIIGISEEPHIGY